MTDHEPAVPAPIDRDVWNAAVEAAWADFEADPDYVTTKDAVRQALSVGFPVLLDALVGRIERAQESDRRERSEMADEFECDKPHWQCHAAAAYVSYEDALHVVRSFAREVSR